MRKSFVLSLGGCLLCAAFAVAQNPPSNINQPPDKRTFAPADDKQPIAHLPTRTEYRSFTAAPEVRSAVGAPRVRELSGVGSADRIALADTNRYLNRDQRDSAAAHNTTFAKVEPGEKVNRLSDTGDRHNLADSFTSRNQLPQQPAGLQERLDRSSGGRYGVTGK